jgi:polysaccharide export outer membrane protein
MRWIRKLPVLLLLLPMLASGSDAVNDYLVGEGDVLRVNVYDHPDLNATVRVSNGGTVLFPLVGEIAIGGLTVGQVAEQIAATLADGYLVSPQVSVFVQEFRSRRAIIMGQVKNPGLYELSGPTTILELISKAGGLSPAAGETVTIKRKSARSPGQENLLSINLKKLMQLGDAESNVSILDGDSVFVEQAGMVYVTGEVNRPNAYRMEDGTSVIKAITMAGGFTDLAAKGRVKIIRKVGGKEEVLDHVPMHTPVLPDDVIVVPESFF